MNQIYKFTPTAYSSNVEYLNMEVLEYVKTLNYLNNACFIIDKKVFELYFNDFTITQKCLIFNASEKNKSDVYVAKIINFFHDNNLNRASTVYAIGGGITTDITAFCASIFKRGIKLVMIPTTLLAMIDAAIGGKTAINFQQIKNQIGTFYPAQSIVINPNFLKSLNEFEFYNGLVECIKSLIIQNNYNKARELIRNIQINQELIKEIIDTKLSICINDMEDNNERRLLNFGHSFAHVFESLSDHKIAHGEAVAYGMLLSIKLSIKFKIISEEKATCYLDLFNDLISINPNFPEFSKLMQSGSFKKRVKYEFIEFLKQDKKNSNNTSLILMNDEYNLIVYNTDENDIIRDLVLDNLIWSI